MAIVVIVFILVLIIHCAGNLHQLFCGTVLTILVSRAGVRLPSNLGHLAPAPPYLPTSLPFGDQACKMPCNLALPLAPLAPLARRLVYLLETKSARLHGNPGRNLDLKGIKIGRLRGNLAQMILLNEYSSIPSSTKPYPPYLNLSMKHTAPTIILKNNSCCGKQ